MFEIIPIPAFNDNYIWMIIHPPSGQCLIVDPGQAQPVLKALEQFSLKLAGILITHHHYDHTGGVDELLNYYPVPVFGPSREKISGLSHPLKHGDIVQVQQFPLELEVLGIPGHTLGHIAYYAPGMLFSGDTLFTGGCGRVFEGTMEEMYHSLNNLAALPEDTQVYCGHEYTLANCHFAQLVEPHNPDIIQRIQEVTDLRNKDLATVPAPLAREKLTNPFLRSHHPDVISATSSHAGRPLKDPIEVFTTLRAWKNSL